MMSTSDSSTRALLGEQFRKWIMLLTDPMNVALAGIAFLNTIAPMLPKQAWQGVALATSAALFAVKARKTPSQGSALGTLAPGAENDSPVAAKE